MEPIAFQPLYQQRVWGGRKLETIYHRELPDSEAPYGESWEISDREEAQSVIVNGPYKGRTLHDLWTNERATLFGNYDAPRFPLLIKILDAQTDLSIQVHPPAEIADSLNGEPKTEMWYIAHAEPDAKIYVGLKAGTTKEAFETALKNGDPENLVHAIYPKTGESIHIPSGRLHAIGAGLVIYEIQQNSDTTYRVFDWNRVGLDGVPRELHIEESMKCIDFDDFEPEMDQPNGTTLAHCSYYKVDKHNLQEGEKLSNDQTNKFSIITVVEGTLVSAGGEKFSAGDFMILPIGADPLTAKENSVVLTTTIDL